MAALQVAMVQQEVPAMEQEVPAMEQVLGLVQAQG